MPPTDLRVLVAEAGKATEELRDVLNRMARLTYESSATPSNAKKLTENEVSDIRSLHRGGVRQVQLADMFDVNPATISRIVRGIYHRSAA